MPSHPSGPPPELDGLPPSSRIGKFVRTTLLGRGGSGDVYKAWDTELNRWVALKFLRSDDESESARLRREAQTAARLNHPNICAVYDVAVHEGRPFIAMQFIDGAMLAHGPDLRRGVRHVRDAALAVHYAHQQGVIHRDIKPANLMLEEPEHSSAPARGSSAQRPAPTAPRIYVMDFGLAKQLATASSLSVSGMMVGTPAYMPPEQARGQAQLIDARSDVYALGATLYELATGHAPFRGENALDIAMQIIHDDPLPPRATIPNVDPDIETIILKSLEKEPEHRYATAEELAADLSRWLEGEPIHAHPPSTLYRIRKRLKKNRVAAITILVAAAAIALIVSFVLPRWSADRAARLAAEQRQAEFQEVNRLWSEFLVVREWSRQPFREAAAVRDARIRAIASITRFAETHPDVAAAWYIRARAALHEGRLSDAASAAARALKADATFTPALGVTAQVRLELWRRALQLGDVSADTLQAQAREALTVRPTASAERFGLARTDDDAVAAVVWSALEQAVCRSDPSGAVDALTRAHKAGPSEEYCRWLAQFIDTAGEQRRWLDEAVRIAPWWLPGRLDRATFAYDAGRFTETASDATVALDLDPGSAFAYQLRGAAHFRLGRREEAHADFNQAIERDPRNASLFTNRGAVLKELGDDDAAIQDHTRALAIEPDHPHALTNRGIILAMRGDRDGALADLDRAVTVAPRWYGAWSFRANARTLLGDRDGALRDYERALELNPRDAQIWANLGNLHRESGRRRDALAAYSKAVEADPDSVTARTNRGLLRRDTGDLKGSLADFDHAIGIKPDDADSWTNRGKTKHAMGNLAGSIADHTKAIELAPARAEPYYNRALARAADNDRTGAIADYTLAIERKRDYPDALTNRGLQLMITGEFEAALADQKRAVELEPENPVYRTNLGVVLGKMGDKEGAIAEWERALRLAPSDWPYRRTVDQMIKGARK